MYGLSFQHWCIFVDKVTQACISHLYFNIVCIDNNPIKKGAIVWFQSIEYQILVNPCLLTSNWKTGSGSIVRLSIHTINQLLTHKLQLINTEWGMERSRGNAGNWFLFNPEKISITKYLSFEFNFISNIFILSWEYDNVITLLPTITYDVKVSSGADSTLPWYTYHEDIDMIWRRWIYAGVWCAHIITHSHTAQGCLRMMRIRIQGGSLHNVCVVCGWFKQPHLSWVRLITLGEAAHLWRID